MPHVLVCRSASTLANSKLEMAHVLVFRSAAVAAKQIVQLSLQNCNYMRNNFSISIMGQDGLES